MSPRASVRVPRTTGRKNTRGSRGGAPLWPCSARANLATGTTRPRRDLAQAAAPLRSEGQLPPRTEKACGHTRETGSSGPKARRWDSGRRRPGQRPGKAGEAPAGSLPDDRVRGGRRAPLPESLADPPDRFNNLLGTIKPAPAGSRANLLDPYPIFPSPHVLGPERPGLAL